MLYFYSRTEDPDTRDLKNAYPVLSRFQEQELFGDILDDIGLALRSYAGIIIEVRIFTLYSKVESASDQ